MATRAAREKLQSQNDRHKEILAKMLAKEENKFCADCLSKGPRWVSWNLGIFVCIRCSGIHRSLGVHISKVKSVNLDTWTPDQMTSVCKRGNGWAKETFEARLPKDYPRPQNDSSMEYFIRDKYENKKYMSSTAIPLRSLEGLYDEEKGEPAKRISSNRNTNVSLPAAKNATPAAKLSPVPRRQTTTTQLPKQQTSATVVDDLLGLESPVKQPSSSTTPASTTATPTPPSADLTFDLFQSAPSVNPPPSSAFQTKTDTSTTTSSGGGKTVMSKDSILSLYSQNPTARQQTTTNNQQFINPTTNQFGGMTQVHQTSGFPSTNPYNFQQQGGGVATTTTAGGGMIYNQQQQFPQQQFQWQQQQSQQQPLHMQMGNMNMNGRGFPQQQQQANMYQQQQQYHPQQQQGFTPQQQQGFTPQQQMYGGFGGQQPQQFRPQSGASGWQQNGQTLSNHLWK